MANMMSIISLALTSPAKGEDEREAFGWGSAAKTTPPRIVFGDPTLPLQGRIKSKLPTSDGEYDVDHCTCSNLPRKGGG
jgi:hypothetical protein